MNTEFTDFLKLLKVPLLSAADIAALRQLQEEWAHWWNREQQIMPLRIEEQRKLAYATFLDSPTEENERCLTVLADPNLTATRYALLRRAFADLRARVSARAGEILRPVVQRISSALDTEHARRLETAEPVMSSKQRNPIVIESRKAMEHADRLACYVLGACGGKNGDRSPLALADVLMKGAEDAQ